MKLDFHRTGRATGSIALGTCKEKSDSAGLGRNRSTLLASFILALDPTTHRKFEIASPRAFLDGIRYHLGFCNQGVDFRSRLLLEARYVNPLS